MKAIRKKGPFETIPFTRGSDLGPGSVVVVGTIVGVDTHGGLNGTDGALDIEGTFSIEKVTEVSFTVGETVYWNTTADPQTPGVAETGAVTATTSDHVLGICTEPTSNDDDTHVTVSLEQYVAPTS